MAATYVSLVLLAGCGGKKEEAPRPDISKAVSAALVEDYDGASGSFVCPESGELTADEIRAGEVEDFSCTLDLLKPGPLGHATYRAEWDFEIGRDGCFKGKPDIATVQIGGGISLSSFGAPTEVRGCVELSPGGG